MTIKVGDKLPEANFLTMTSEGVTKVSTDDIFAGRTVVLFALPGAFTPTCNNVHVPGFVENAANLKAKGVDMIVCVSVNDVHVMAAWGKQVSPGNEVMMLADGNAEFTKATGLDIDLTVAGMGVRSSRYSMLVKDGVVQSLNREPAGGEADVSGAQEMLASL